MNASFNSLSPQQLRRAADVKERVDSLQSELARLLGGSLQPVNQTSAPHKRTMSAAGRARIAAAARKRWASIKRSNPAKTGAHPKRQMSAAAKARLSAIARARWKRVRAEGRTAL